MGVVHVSDPLCAFRLDAGDIKPCLAAVGGSSLVAREDSALLQQMRIARQKGVGAMSTGAMPASDPGASIYPVGVRAAPQGGSGQNVDKVVDRRISRMFGIASAFVMLSLAGVWVLTEYINHGGWPSGATLGAGGDGVWNLWIIYPMIAGVLLLGLHWCMTYVTSPMRHQKT